MFTIVRPIFMGEIWITNTAESMFWMNRQANDSFHNSFPPTPSFTIFVIDNMSLDTNLHNYNYKMSDTQNSALYKGIGGNFGNCAFILLNEGAF